MEELLLDFSPDEMEEIQKSLQKYSFPAVHLSDSKMIFNKSSDPLLGEAVKFFVTSEYVIGITANKNDTNAYMVFGAGESSDRVKAAAFPARLRNEKKLKNGYYKLYKCKNGFAFKRYEPLGG